MLSFARGSITRVRYPSDEVGEPDFTATPDEATIGRCSVQPGASLEILDRGERVRVAWTVYAPPGADITGSDFARVNGDLYRVVGDPEPWSVGLRRVGHLVIYLERWKG